MASIDTLITALNDLIAQEQVILGKISEDPNSGNTPELEQALTTIITTRQTIYEFILGVLTNDQGTFNSSMTVFGDQLAALKVLEQSLNDTKIQLNAVQENNVKKLRLIEINDYYGSKYSDQRVLMIYVFWFSCHMLALCLGYKIGWLTQPVFLFCSAGTVLVFLLYFFLPKYFDISFRDNMNYQEYAWGQYANPNDIDLSNPNGTNPWANTKCECS